MIMFNGAREFNGGLVHVDYTFVNSLITMSGAGEFILPSPNLLPFGVMEFRKGDNDSNLVRIKRDDNSPICEWKHITLPMHGDWVRIVSFNGEYIIIGEGQVFSNQARGQHRTPFSNQYPVYAVHDGDRGAWIRYHIAQGDTSGIVMLPSKEQMGFVPGGYRNGYRVIIQAFQVPTNGYVEVKTPPESGIHRKGASLKLYNNLEVLEVDFDSHEWMILNHYIPSTEADRP